MGKLGRYLDRDGPHTGASTVSSKSEYRLAVWVAAGYSCKPSRHIEGGHVIAIITAKYSTRKRGKNPLQWRNQSAWLIWYRRKSSRDMVSRVRKFQSFEY